MVSAYCNIFEACRRKTNHLEKNETTNIPSHRQHQTGTHTAAAPRPSDSFTQDTVLMRNREADTNKTTAKTTKDSLLPPADAKPPPARDNRVLQA